MERELTLEEFKQKKKEQKGKFTAMQKLPYEVKVKRAELRAIEFYEEMQKRGMNCHVSVGGLDSITLLMFLRKIGIDVPAISVSSLEDKSIQKIHKALGVIRIPPDKSKVKVIQEHGFPVISKRVAGKLEVLQNPTDKNQTMRHACMTGECGKQGHYAKKSRMKLPQKWLELFAGMENEKYGTSYQTAPFKISNKCCHQMKEKPCDRWAREHNSKPYLGLMASEGGQREEGLVTNGCNYYGKTVIRSAPFAPFLRQDLLRLAREMDLEWILHRSKYKDETLPDSIIPEIYGTIERKADGTLYTTGAQRTGCSMCGFGVHMEKRPHRFDALRKRNYKEWEFWMYRCCTDEETGEKYGWGRVLDHIGVGWEDEFYGNDEQIQGQMTTEDFGI